MAPPTRRGFARLLARLDRAAFAWFLAAVWSARGRPAEVADGRVVVGDGPTLRPHAPPRGLPATLAAPRVARAVEGNEVVATTDPAVAAALRDRGVRVVGPDDLRRALLYDLDRPTARAVAHEHLGHSLDGSVTSPVDRVRTAVPVLVAVVAVVAVAALVLPSAVGDAGGEARTDSGAADGATPGTSADADANGSDAVRVAPGVTTAGVVDATELARAHAEAVRGRSYEWEIDYREYASRRGRIYVPVARSRTVRVESETEFSDAVRGWGTVHASPLPERDRVVYADGSSRFVRSTTNGTTTVERYPISFTSDGAGYFADLAAAHVRRFAGANRTEVVGRTTRGDVTYYRLGLRDDGPERIADLRGTALVAPSGFVEELRVTYALPERNRSVSVTFRYAGLDATAVEPPIWYPGTRNATDGGGNESTPAALEDRGSRRG